MDPCALLRLDPPGPLLGGSTAMARLLEAADRVARTPRTTVLITGEPGSGKARLAREVHLRSGRSQGPLVELRRPSWGPGELDQALARAQGGTLVLRQVGRLDALAQGALLEVLGNGEEHGADVRIVATTHDDLDQLVDAGAFRDDLFYRLNVLTLHVPALRERAGDVGRLAGHFLARQAEAHGLARPGLGPCELKALEGREWPGNVRELELEMERWVLTGQSPSTPSTPSTPSSPSSSGATDVLPLGDRALRTVEEGLIRCVLEEAGGNRSRAARTLGINRATLYNKLRRYGIEAS